MADTHRKVKWNRPEGDGFSIRWPRATLPSNHAKGCQAPGIDLSSGLLGKRSRYPK